MTRHDRTSTWATVRLAGALVWSAGRRETLWTAVATVASSVAIAGQLLAGRQVLQLLTDDTGRTFGDAVPWLVVLAVLLVLAALANAASAELRLLLGDLVHRRSTDQILEVAAASELEAFEEPGFHDRLRRAQTEAGDHAWRAVWGIVTMANTAGASIAVSIVLLAVAPVLVPVALIAYLPIAVVNVLNNRALYRLHWDLTEVDRDRDYHERLLTRRDDAPEVRAFGLAPYLRARHDALWATRIGRVRRLVQRRLWLSLASSGLTSLVFVGTLAVIVALALDDRIGVGDAAVAIVGLQQLSNRLRSAGDALASVHQGVTFLRDFADFRAELDAHERVRPTLAPPAQPGELTVTGLGYRYPGSEQRALADVSFTVRRGEVLAIVGANGSGKSTLAKLVCGLLPPTTGTVRWDGVDVATCDPALVRARVAPVLQDFARFELPAREVIGFGDVTRLDDAAAIDAAAKEAGADEVIDALPHGIDTRLGKAFTDGADLSTGQWQRLAIARAFFRDAQIVVLDEPSASLDPRAETDLFDRLRALCHDRIVVFVSHRFATVRSADAVLVLDEGRVVEHGSHDALMAHGGVYADLFRLQAERYGLTG